MADDGAVDQAEPEPESTPEPDSEAVEASQLDAEPSDETEGAESRPVRQQDEDEPAEDAEKAPADPDELSPDKEIEFTVKIDGKERVEKATLHELIESHQKARASDERFREAAHKEKGVKTALTTLLGDPVKGFVQLAMAQHNCDEKTAETKVDEFFIDYYARKLSQEAADAKLSPEQRELRQTKAELDAIRKRDAEAQKARERQEADTHADQYLRKVDADVMSALKAQDVKADAAIVKAVLQKISKSFSLGREIPAEVAVKAVLRERKAQLEELFKTLPLADLIEKYPEHADQLQRIDSDRLQKNRAKLKGETRPGAQRTATSTSTRESKPRYVSPSDSFADLLRS